MKRVTLQDKSFKRVLSGRKIARAIRKTAKVVSCDMCDAHPLFISILNGAFIFTAELMKNIEIPDAEICFVKLSSYNDTTSSGSVTEVIGLNRDIAGRNIVIVEDMVDSGLSMHHLVERLKELSPASIKIVALFVKPHALRYPVTIDYPVMELENDFVVGYGLDYNELGRQLPDLYQLER